MGLSNLPAPAEGLLCILLVNTALTTISIFRRIFRSIPLIPYSSFSTHYSSSTSYSSSSFDQVFHSPSNNTTTPYSSSSSDQYTFIEEFHRRVPAIRFDSISTTIINCNSSQQADCTVCLTRFEPDSEVNRLCHCGHIFHKLCLERWLDYWNITCPLCRTPLLLMSSSSSSQQLVLHQHDHHDDHVHDLVHEELEDQEEGEAASVLAFGDHIF